MNDYTDVISAIRRKLRRVYSQAEGALKERIREVLQPYQSEINGIEKLVEDKKITKEAAKQRLTALLAAIDDEDIRSLAESLHEANAEADRETKKKVPAVLAAALSLELFGIEKEMGEDIGLVPFSEDDISEWMEEDEDLFDPGAIDEERDVEWNGENIRRAITTGVLLGLGADALISYISSAATKRNRESFFSRVYNIISGAHETGRQTAMEIATRRGVEIQKEWIATLDFKTRDAHRELDGQRVPADAAFTVDGEEIRFPRDPQAKAYLRCNCRCDMKRMRAHWSDDGKRKENVWNEEHRKPVLQRMTYSEWMEMKVQELGQDEVDRIIREMKREQAKKAYRRRKRKLQQGGVS